MIEINLIYIYTYIYIYSYNWSFIQWHLRRLTCTKNNQLKNCVTSSIIKKWTIKLLFRNSRICKHETNCKNPPPLLFYVDVINVWSLCYGKCIKMVTLLLNFCQFLKLLTFSSSDISVIGHSELLALIFFLISCVHTVIPL